ncbi:MAG: VanW family protein [Jiangellales bacterium]
MSESIPPGQADGEAATADVTAGGTQARSSKRRWRVGIGVVVTVLLLGGAYLAAYLNAGTTVASGTTVLGIEIGGLTQEEAEATLRDELPAIADVPVTLLVDADSYAIVPSESGLNVDVAATVRTAGVGSSDPLRLLDAIVRGGGPVDPVVTVDEPALQQAIADVAEQADREAVEGTVVFAAGNVEATLPQQGRTVDQPGSVEAVADAYLSRSAPVDLPTSYADPLTDEAEVERALSEFAEPAMSGPVTLESEIDSSKLSTVLLSTVLSMEADEDGALVPALDGEALLAASTDELAALGDPPTDASVVIRGGRPVVVTSSAGLQPDTSAYVEDVLAALTETGDGRVVRLPLTTEPAAFTTRDARASGVREVVAEFTTFYPYAEYRNINIGRAAELANNTFLKPGDVFSMNDVVGERRVDRGFTSGFIIESGRFAEAVGGGVSQLATTLFNAGHFAGFSDIEHHAHTLYIDRYPVGREATVFYGSLDLRFGNNTPYGAVVQSFIRPATPGTQGEVTVRIWSTPHWEVESVTGNRFNPRPYERKVIAGDSCVPSTGSDGFDIIVTRTLSLGGEVERREEIYTRYEATPEVVCTG